jgi:hypothetical protein
VPLDFRVPDGFSHEKFSLVPLGPEHNDRDYRAWTLSMEHIQRTPGFEQGDWPRRMTIEDNLRDLVQHADDFRHRVGFTYSVMAGDVIGCVYIYPSGRPGHAMVRSWVREDRAHLDGLLYELVGDSRRPPAATPACRPRRAPQIRGRGCGVGMLQRLDAVAVIDGVLDQARVHGGVSVGTYLALAALNRVCDPRSKAGFASWWSGTASGRLLKIAAGAINNTLTSEDCP